LLLAPANFALREVSTAAYGEQQTHLRSIVVVVIVDHGVWPLDFNDNKNPDGSRLHALGNEPIQMTRMMGTTWEIEIHTPEDPPKTPERQAIQDKFQDA